MRRTIHDGRQDRVEWLYTAPAGRWILSALPDDESGELVVTLDNGAIERVQIAAPAGVTIQ